MSLPFPALRHFSIVEFAHPELMDNAVLQWLDEVRHASGVPWILTSDARTPEHNAAVGGSPRSLHVLGRAIDFTLRKSDADSMFRVMQAACSTPTPGGVGREVEFVIGDNHWHLGLFPDQRPSRLILKAED